jgi:hypothetical protein
MSNNGIGSVGGRSLWQWLQDATRIHYPTNTAAGMLQNVQPVDRSGDYAAERQGAFTNPAPSPFADDRDRGSGALQQMQGPSMTIGDLTGLGGLSGLLGALGSMTGQMSQNAQQQQQNNAPWATYTPSQYEYQPVQLPDAQEFKFRQNDYTQQAQDMAAKAYGPQFAAIDAATKEAKSRNTQQDQLVQGLGTNLLADLGKSQSAQQERLATAAADATAAGKAQAGDIAASRDNSNAQVAKLLAQYGTADAMGRNLQQGADESAYQQGRATEKAGNIAAQYAKEKTDKADYNDEINRATELQTSSDRQDLISQLNQALYGYGQQRQAGLADQASTANDLAFKLSDRDFQNQQAQYGAYNDQINRATQVALADAAARNQVGLANMQSSDAAAANAANVANQQRQSTMSLQAQQAQAEQDAAAAAQDQANKDREYDLERTKFQTGAELDQDKFKYQQQQDAQNPQGGLTFEQQDPLTQVRTLVTQQTGSQVQADQAVAFLGQLAGDPVYRNLPKYEFMMKASEEAQKNPSLNARVVANAAAQYWDAFMSKGSTGGLG